MAKFKVVKKFSLDFLGEDWKDCYLDFAALTVGDLRDKLPSLSSINEKDQNDVVKGIDAVLNILKDRFLEGKGVNESGEVVNIKPEELKDLPAEVLSKALNFLSQGVTPNSPTQ